jgi:hypothetical protein
MSTPPRRVLFSQRKVTPSLIASKSGSPRKLSTASNSASTVSLKMEKSSPAMKSLMTPSFLRSLNDFRNPTQSLPQVKSALASC